MNNLFGEEVYLSENIKINSKKEPKQVKTVVWNIYRVVEKEENYYFLFCAKSYSHAKYLYCLDIGLEYMEADVNITKLHLFKDFIREIDKGLEITFLDDKYWEESLHKIGGYYEYTDKKISVEEIKNLDIDSEYISIYIPKK